MVSPEDAHLPVDKEDLHYLSIEPKLERLRGFRYDQKLLGLVLHRKRKASIDRIFVAEFLSVTRMCDSSVSR